MGTGALIRRLLDNRKPVSLYTSYRGTIFDKVNNGSLGQFDSKHGRDNWLRATQQCTVLDGWITLLREIRRARKANWNAIVQRTVSSSYYPALNQSKELQLTADSYVFRER